MPGRLLTELDLDRPAVTTFAVVPDGTGSRVRIETTWRPAAGLAGLIERLVAPPLLGRLYADELKRLERYSVSLRETEQIVRHWHARTGTSAASGASQRVRSTITAPVDPPATTSQGAL